MGKTKTNQPNLNKSLKKLEEISRWFEEQEEVDVEQGLQKVKEAIELLKASRVRLQSIENEFKEIKKEIGPEEENGIID